METVFSGDLAQFLSKEGPSLIGSVPVLPDFGTAWTFARRRLAYGSLCICYITTATTQPEFLSYTKPETSRTIYIREVSSIP
jgi:hypothetical protein